MTRFIIGGVPIRVHPLLPLMAVLACFLGDSGQVLTAILSLTLHETAHVVAARAMGLHVVEMELMPFGGAARIDEIWTLRPAQLMVVALAGPIVNLLIILCAAALAWWGIIGIHLAAMILWVNGVLMAFNMLPALPLDGGRVLCGLLSVWTGPERAIQIGIWAGRILAALLVAADVAGFLAWGNINVMLLFCAVYLVACAQREKQSGTGAALRSMVDRQAEMAGETVLPIRWLAVSGEVTIAQIARGLRPRKMHMLAVYDDDMHYAGSVDEKTLLAALMRNPNEHIASLLPKHVKKSSTTA